MVDPLGWWPGKYAESKRIAQLVEEFLPAGDVLACGGLEVFAELLPGHRVTTARLDPDALRLPHGDNSFDVAVSARVLEILPPEMRRDYVLELLRVSRYRAFLALPLQPELEAIDKIKNPYIWDTSRVWLHAAPRPRDLERMLAGSGVCLAYHVDRPAGADVQQLEASRELVEAMLMAPALQGADLVPGLGTPSFVVAEISKPEIVPQSLALAGQEAH